MIVHRHRWTPSYGDRNGAGFAGAVIDMGPSDEKFPTVAPSGRASEASESPGGAAQAAELLTEVWFAYFTSKAERLELTRWLGRDVYSDVMALLSQLAGERDRSEVTELLDGASNADELVTVWCYLIDDASAAVRQRWVPALRACRRAIETPAERPQPLFGGL